MDLPKQEVLDEIIQRIVQVADPEKIILFGSAARGKMGPDSDVDLLVVVNQSNERPTKRATRAHRCLRGMGVSKDILVHTRSEIERSRYVYASLLCEILERGRVLYE